MSTQRTSNSTNVSELPAEKPAHVLRPERLDDVISAVRSQPERGGSLRAIGTGRNWGLGSASSPGPNETLLDLSGLDRIRVIEPELGYAVVEAGVTQAKLSQALVGSGRFLNCTASSPHTSVLGNMMDRGVGLRHQRTQDLLGLEVVTASGDVGTVGWWPSGGGAAPNEHGLGSSLLQLFPQSSLGVATAAVVRLLPEPEASRVVTFTVSEDRFEQLVTTLRGIVRDRLTNAVIKIYDAASSDIYGGTAAITGHICVDGATALLPAMCSEVERSLANVGATVLSEEQVRVDPLAAAVVTAYRGDPLGNEVIVRSALGVSTEDADEHGRGWIFVLPFVPFTATDLVRARTVVHDAAPEAGDVQVGTTVNTLDHDVVDLVIAVRFDRGEPTSVEAAHRTLDRLYQGLVEAGYHPYRLDTAHRRSHILPDRTLASTLARRIKSAIDPENVFGDSRYLN